MTSGSGSNSGTASSSGIRFGPTSNSKHYVSLFRHRGSGDVRHKQTWDAALSPTEEFAIFENADVSDSKCSRGHYWGYRDYAGQPIGSKKERIAKFPVTTNPNDDWHGYPVHKDERRNNDDLPSDELVTRWIEEKKIDERFGLKIIRGAV